MLRIGLVTNIYPEEGKVKVYYEDTDNTSDKLAILKLNDEYYMPKVNDYVATLHRDDGSSVGYVIGTFWNAEDKPTDSQADYIKVIKKRLSNYNAVITYKNNVLTVTAPKIRFVTDSGEREF